MQSQKRCGRILEISFENIKFFIRNLHNNACVAALPIISAQMSSMLYIRIYVYTSLRNYIFAY